MTARADISAVLTQMRQLQVQAQSQIDKPAAALDKLDGVQGPNFGEMMSSAIDKVNEQQMESSNLATAFERGDPSVDLTQVMISMQKSSISFQAMTQVRNRLVSAYEDIMNMPV